MIYIKRDGEEKAKVKDVNEAFAWLLKHQSQSVYHALRYEGWSVEDEKGNKQMTGYSQPVFSARSRGRQKSSRGGRS